MAVFSSFNARTAMKLMMHRAKWRNPHDIESAFDFRLVEVPCADKYKDIISNILS